MNDLALKKETSNTTTKDEHFKRKKIMKLKDYRKSVQEGKFEITAHYDSNIFKSIQSNKNSYTQRNLPKLFPPPNVNTPNDKEYSEPNKSVFEEAQEKFKNIKESVYANKNKNDK